MKKSELQQLIREELAKANSKRSMTEAIDSQFADRLEEGLAHIFDAEDILINLKPRSGTPVPGQYKKFLIEFKKLAQLAAKIQDILDNV